ncbi:metallophosphoesterase [Nitrosomonas sp.]|uniref:metallophosphoesterase family protein n=1 Tax=Nitrosomonas sp. TaxID=42353 RepID=UPI00208C6EBD|nr:metallophosphoesterase family protein [Nitrosomonas sp.]GJL76558.1 MAG: 3',5'-cyclic-nucleotide phosphodiesterase [Nitrosomonas sp.]
MTKILHLSDLHFGKHFLPGVSEVVLAQVETLSPDVIVISGDFTQRAKPQEFEAALKFLQRLPPLPRVIVPGNHDVPLYRFWERLLHPHALYQNYLADKLDTSLYVDDAVFVGLDSTAPYRAIKNGRLSREQLAFCAHTFAAVPEDILRIVVMHHHLVPAPTFDRTWPMPQAKRTLEAFTRMRVDVVLAGHLHRAYVGHSLDVYAGENRDHGIIIVQCGTTTSRRGRGLEREKNSFNLITLSNTDIQVEHYHYHERIAIFEPVSRHTFKRRRPAGTNHNNRSKLN